MSIRFRYLPLLVQHEVMQNMNLIDVFSLSATSKKSRILTKSYFNRQKCVVEFIVHRKHIHIHRNRSSKNYSSDRDFVKMSSIGMYHSLEVQNPNILMLNIPGRNTYQEMLNLAVEMFPKLTLNLDFPTNSSSAYVYIFREVMTFVRTLNVPIITVKVGPEHDINDDLMRCVLLKSCTDVKNLTIRSFSHARFRLTHLPVPPFKFDFLELRGAEWVTKDRLINLFLSCKKVILGSFIRLTYTDQELVEICEKWLEAPVTQYLEIQMIETFSEGIGRLTGAVPVRRVMLNDEVLDFSARKCYKMEKVDGTPAIIYHHEDCIVFRTDFENAVIGEGVEPVDQDIEEEEENPFVRAFPGLFRPVGFNYYW